MIAMGALALMVGPAQMIQAESSDTYRQLNLFGDVFELIREEYVDEVDDSEIIEAAINGMLSSLDPHSSYMNPKSFEDMQVQTRGEFGGLGIEVTLQNGLVKVISPIDDTPASKAGIQSGDYITQLDGEAVLGLTLQQAVEKMRGDVGTDITLTIAREGEESTFDVTLTRAVVTIKSVRARLEGDIDYLRITAFNEQTERELKAAMAEAKEKKGDDIKGYIIDLRNNPGGLLDQAIAVADAFLDKGEIVSTRGRYARDTQRYQAHAGDLAGGKPVLVLINGGSASASEIVAGALQDHHRAIVLGTQSFGKGSVQTIRPLSNNGAIRLTTARYYTPSGTSIQAKGITPDIEVKQATLQVAEANGPRRSEATLRGHLPNPEDAKAGKTEEESKLPPIEMKDDADKTSDAEETNPTANDYQLTYALDLLRGLTLISSRTSEL